MAEHTVDVLVIGGGIAGASVAYELAGHRSVLLVEGERTLATHTTGRSAAIYAPSYGGPVVRALTAASRDRFTELRRDLDTPELLTPRGVLWLGCDHKGADEVRALIGRGGVERVSPTRAVQHCPVVRESAVLVAAWDRTTMDIDVMALHAGYVRGLRARGGAVRSGAPVTALAPAGSGWSALVGADRVSAGTVVNAAGAWADRVAEAAGVAPIGLRPMRRTIALASGPGPVDPAWPLVVDGGERFYFRPDSGRMLVSPADETPSEPGDARPDELDVALAIERVNEVTDLGLRSVRTAWAGLRSFVADRAPVAGAWPEHPGFVFFAGQGGYGIQMAPALAVLGAAITLGTAPPAELGVEPSRVAPRTAPNH